MSSGGPVLVTGATGYIGGRLLPTLLARLLGLSAEMRVPGRAWLQFEVDGDERRPTIRQTAIFDPAGLAGLLHWHALLPLHRLVFAGMLDGVARRAEAR